MHVANVYYKNIGKIWCPFLNDYVYFNSSGFRHLIFRHWRKRRTIHQQYLRFKFLPLAPQILSKSHTLQEYREKGKFKYYGFVSIIGKVRLKIIVKQINGGIKFFYSLFPFWGYNTNAKARTFEY